MKIFFDFNLKRQALVCHEMAKYWKEKYGVQDFAGMVAVKNGNHLEYLNNQKEIKYHFIDNRDLIEEDALKLEKVELEKIEKIEKDLDIPLWHLIVADRNMGHFFVKGAVMPESAMMNLASHENILKWVVSYYDLINKRLDEFKPDAVVFLAIASLPPLMLAKICEKKAIPYYILTTSRIKNLYSIIKNNFKGINADALNDFKEILNSNNILDRISRFASDYVDHFKNKPEHPEYMGMVHEKFKKASKKNIFSMACQALVEIGKTAFTILANNKINKESFLRRNNVLSNLFFKLRKNKNIANTRKIFKDSVETGEKYIFFPLHLDPEASTMILAPNFVNQLNLIEIIAKNIPMSYKLYVKEHIPNIGTRPAWFYEEIKRYPNVKLISPWADNFSLIKKSSLVATISGTAGWEAVLMNVPAITFSETFYTKTGFAIYCSNMDKLGEEIRKIILGKKDEETRNQEIKIKALVTAIQTNSFEVNASDLIWGKEEVLKRDDMKKIADSFYKAFNKK